MGLTIGNLVGPPVGGALYQRWGFRAPFIFGIIITGIDLVARLLLIERREAIRWGVDPMEIGVGNTDPESAPEITASERTKKLPVTESKSASQWHTKGTLVGGGDGQIKVEIELAREGDKTVKKLQGSKPRVTLPPHNALSKLVRIPRATVCIFVTLFWGLVWSAQETTVVLHMNRVWGLEPHQAGTVFIAVVLPAVFCESG